MSAVQTPLDDLLAYELACSPHQLELLEEEDVVGLLVSRFRLLTEQGWDWATALLLATAVDTPPSELLAPPARLALVRQ